MKYNFLILVTILIACAHSGLGQGFIPPAKGNSVVYFARVHPYQSSVPFTFFDGDTFITDFLGHNYFRYECKPGEHLFWASSDNTDFIPAELMANETYVVLATPVQGTGLLKVSLSVLHSRHKDFHKAKHIIVTKASVEEDPQKLKEENERMRGFIDRILKEYYTNNAQSEVRLTKESAIPIEKIK
jgi:hypothetical protein